jgi:hypothetical protein
MATQSLQICTPAPVIIFSTRSAGLPQKLQTTAG